MKTIYKKKEQALIPNKIVERLFFALIEDPELRQVYMDKATSTNAAVRASATAYASAKVEKVVMYWKSNYTRTGYDMEYMNYMLFKRDNKYYNEKI